MSEPFALASFLASWAGEVRHDLTASDSESLTVASLLRLAHADDRRRWRSLGLGYAEPRGAPWLRAAIAGRHSRLGPEDILCCAGAQEAVCCAARALLDPGDHAIVIAPLYQPSVNVVTARCAATGVPLDERDWRLDVDRVAAAIRPKTKLVVANVPNSPTGVSLDARTFEALVALCRSRGLWLLNDEVYRQTEARPAELPPMVADSYERGISVNGVSKGFGLPGLRVGWLACRDRAFLARALAVKSMLSTCIASASEVLASVALGAEERIVARRRAIGLHNHRRLAALLGRVPHLFADEPLRNLAFAFPRYLGPEGADVFATRLAREAGLLVLPSSLWRTPLAATPENRVRIALGHTRNEAGLAALGHHLDSGRSGPARPEVAVTRLRTVAA